MTIFGKASEEVTPVAPAFVAPEAGVKEGTMLDRLRGMALIGWAAERLGVKVTQKRIVTEDEAFAAKHGDHSQATRNMATFASDLDRKTRDIEV